MKRAILFTLCFSLSSAIFPQIIADHTVVEKYNTIPQYYIDEVKKMLVWVGGMSHSLGYQKGVNLLELLNSDYQATTWLSDPPPPYTASSLRLGRPWMSNTNFWLEDVASYCSVIEGQNNTGNPYSVIINGWSYETTWNNEPGGGVDPIFDIRWAGDAGNGRWGLDAGDQVLTGNPTCMDTYLAAINSYNLFFANNDIPTIAIFSTGPVDENAGTENGFQRELKNQHIRNYVLANSSAILFDYADILVYNNSGEKYQANWNDGGVIRPHDQIHPDNQLDYDASWRIVNENDADGDHIGEVGALRLAKAIWWLLARIAGWDGGEAPIPVSSITVTGAGGATTITQDNGTLALTATVLPSNATNKAVTWSISNGTGQATISTTGVVTAVANGTVTARATANDGSGVYGELVVTISGQIIPVTGITVTGAGGSSVIGTDGGQLQLTATVIPTNATNKTVTWSISNGTGQGTINTTGVVTAVANGTVTARATANDGSGVFGELVITISGQIIPVTGITVAGAGGSSVIGTDGGQLQLTANVTPSDATNKTVTWSIVNGTGQATINSTGLVTAVSNGTVTAVATASDGSGVTGTLVITISNQVIPVTSITVSGAGGSTQITQDNGTLQLTATVLPTTATNKTVAWSISNGTGQATISTTGVVTAVANGTVTARATANDGSGVYGELVVTISGQIIPVTGITVTGAGGSSVIGTDGGQLQLTAIVIPTNATNKTVTWSIVNGTGQATISSTGLVTAVSSGTVTAVATANDGSGVQGTLVITITNQFIPVTSITVNGAGGATTITQDNGTLALTATVLPSNATNKTVTWSLSNGTGQGTINTTGVVTAVANGTVTARATANDGSGVYGELVVTISGQIIPVTGIIVTGEGGVTTIDTDDGTLQMVAVIAPVNATNKSVTWSLVKGGGHASITETGLVTARSNGIITVRATSNDGSTVFGETDISLVNQIVKVTSIKIKPLHKSSNIATVNGELQLIAELEPVDATDKTVTWSVISVTGEAIINDSGLLTGISPGEVLVIATANDGSGVTGELTVLVELNETIKIRYNRYELIILIPESLLPAKTSLHNLFGSCMLTKNIDDTECIIDVSGLIPGIYVVSIYNSTVQHAAKIIIPY